MSITVKYFNSISIYLSYGGNIYEVINSSKLLFDFLQALEIKCFGNNLQLDN